MTAKTRRLRELLASGEFVYMPSAATPLGRPPRRGGRHSARLYRGYVSGASRAISEPLLTMDEQVRKEIEDLIGLDAYYRIEAETVEPGSRPR